MKKLLILVLAFTIFTACEKLERERKACPTISSEAVPSTVMITFTTKYSETTVVKTWFNKDNKGYCALFTLNGKETKAFFDNNGNFQKEEIEQEGEHEDNDADDDSGCECELEDGD